MKRVLALLVVAVLALWMLAGCKNANNSEDTTTTTSTQPQLEQIVVWPAAGIGFTTPEAVANDFVQKVLGVEPNLGEFQAGDSLSGEIDVYGPNSTVVRGTLLLRKLGADMTWFITAAVSDHATITLPAHQSTINAESITVSGSGRGFEAQLHVKAVDPAKPSEIVDESFPMGGSLEQAEPFTTSINLSNLKSGSTVAIVLQGGVGMEEDPGDFCAIAVQIA